jgi:hypothetical protein
MVEVKERESRNEESFNRTIKRENYNFWNRLHCVISALRFGRVLGPAWVASSKLTDFRIFNGNAAPNGLAGQGICMRCSKILAFLIQNVFSIKLLHGCIAEVICELYTGRASRIRVNAGRKMKLKREGK